MQRVILLLSISILIACQTKPSTQDEPSFPKPLSSSELSSSIEAHGSLERWQSFKELAFTMNTSNADGDQQNEEHFLLDLQNRHERITGAGYQMGYNGNAYWQVLDEGLKEKNVPFMINLQFYFFAMPFVMADPGVNIESLGQKELNGKTYKVIKAGFDEGVGLAPKDQYILYFDSTSDLLHLLLYSVTYFKEENAEKYNALHYAEWQEVSGLQVARKMDRYVWDTTTDSLGSYRGSKTFTAVSFKSSSPEQSNFTPPANAILTEK